MRLEEAKVKAIMYEKLTHRIGFGIWLNPAVAKTLKLDEVYDRFIEQVLYYIEVSLAGKNRKIKDEKVKEELLFPVSAWDHFKLDYFPLWLLEKFPAKTKTVVTKIQAIYEVTNICPHIQAPEHDYAHYHFLETGGIDEFKNPER